MKKILTLLSLAFAAMTATAQVYLDPNAPIEERVQDALSRMTTHEKIKILHAQSKFTSAGVPRLGIRQLNMDDGPHGVREELEWNTWSVARWTNDSIVAFPSLTCLTATWNRDLSALYGHSVSEEFAFRGKDIMLGPGVNIQRTPMNGRAFEYMGEDPFLAGEMVVPYIQSAQKNGVACCLKHFVLNDQEIDRFNVNVNVSERAMREIYLFPFKRAVDKAHVYTIMGSYNLWNGDHCCHNDALLNGILKKEWGWDGALVSDWGGTTNTMQAAYGGLDIEMGTYTDGKVKEAQHGYSAYYLADPFEKLINEGKIPMEVLDEKAARVLRTIFRTSMNPQKVIGFQCSEAHYDACRQIGEEGIVLLKNEKGMLPLDASRYKRILVVGENATRSLTQGGGSSELKTLYDVSPWEAFNSQLSTANCQLTLAQGYKSGRSVYDHVDKVDSSINDSLRSAALEAAKQADLIIFVGGFNKNHKQDCENGDRESYDLPFGQSALISALAKIQPNLIIVTFGGNPYAMPWLPQAKALLHCWYLGSEAGDALANILTGKVNPSGKLPVTFAKRLEDYPYAKFGQEAYPGITDVKVPANSAGEVPHRQVYYKEDIYVGYRGFDKDKVQPLFPFGFGLSYTTFAYGKPTATVQGDNIVLSVAVTNTGKVAGKEVVQIYASAPANKSLPKPQKELKGFGKTRLLAPGESETLTITIPRSDLASWNESTHQWQVDGGTYTLSVAASAADVRQKVNVNIP
ncbi:MAG: glycoside hydrolase family 3 C-terminal domain-containing protein [Bacteroidaceae bacterium]|nr:glycoside hydrolase family 3 C-terminal domain-containing protein [Bacteroidaceae bacterium]